MSSTSAALSPPVRPRLTRRVGLRLDLTAVVAAATLALGWGALVLTHNPTRPVVPRSVALHYVLADRPVAQMLARARWDRSDLTPMDRGHEMLGFYRGPRLVATVIVGFSGHVVILDIEDLTTQTYAYGSNIANDGRVLALLAAVFVLMTAVWPVRRIRNLDVLVAASFAVSVALFNRWLLTRMVLVSYPALAYLALRCAWWGLGRRREPRRATPLYDHLTRNWAAARQVRMLRLAAVVSALVVVMVGLTSLRVLDVGYAVMEGATLIVHGVLPYGHIQDVFHGDTYPIGSYLLYVPFASLFPVHSVWDDADVTLVVAAVAALIAAWGLSRMSTAGSRSVPSGPPNARARVAGLRSAIALLTFPPLLVTVSTGTTDVALAAMLVPVFILWRRPAWGMAVLSCAAWFKLAPLVIMPQLLARLRNRALVCAVAAVVVTSAIVLAIVVALGGLDAPARMLSAMSFQFTRASQHSLWAVVGSVPLQQLVQAATLALVLGSAVRLRRDRTLAEDRSRIAAIAAAALLGLQISASYWSYMYLVWAFPLIALSLLGETPAASERVQATR
jgi:hypothetical protein